jgi:hypothetical protein
VIEAQGVTDLANGCSTEFRPNEVGSRYSRLNLELFSLAKAVKKGEQVER